MTTYTTSLRLWQGTPGDPAIRNAWGTFLNTDFSLIDSSITGLSAVNIAGLTTYSLTTGNGTADQARELMQNYTGALTGDCTVTLPAVQKVGWARNQTTGGFNVILNSGGGADATLPPDSAWYLYWVNGTTVSLLNIGLGTLKVSGATTFTGAVTHTGVATFNGAANYNAAASFGSTATFNNTVTHNGTENFNGAVTFGTTVTHNGNETFTANTALTVITAAFGNNVQCNPNFTCTQTVFASSFVTISDRRRKSNIVSISPEVGELWAISSNPVTYLMDGQTPGAGFIAQEQLRTPAGQFVVSQEYNDLPHDPDVADGRALALNYNNHDAFLVAALKSAFKKIDALSSRLEALEQG